MEWKSILIKNEESEYSQWLEENYIRKKKVAEIVPANMKFYSTLYKICTLPDTVFEQKNCLALKSDP